MGSVQIKQSLFIRHHPDGAVWEFVVLSDDRCAIVRNREIQEIVQCTPDEIDRMLAELPA